MASRSNIDTNFYKSSLVTIVIVQAIFGCLCSEQPEQILIARASLNLQPAL
jgi:hypothetical protein